MIKVDEIILQWALRYALGRQTYAPSTVQEAVYDNLSKLSKRFLVTASNDLAEAAKFPGGLGSDLIDAPGWAKLHAAIVEAATVGA